MRREIVSFAKLPLNVIARTLGHAEKNKLFGVCCADSGRWFTQ
ncbi:relaxase NikB domain protein [Escherichia coli MP021561.3]|nr:relaxase NikB domain protein [Escherichia coli MP021561.3]ENB49152.1 relaxase NikB domain protein [Escherichia coli MP021561.3]